MCFGQEKFTIAIPVTLHGTISNTSGMQKAFIPICICEGVVSDPRKVSLFFVWRAVGDFSVPQLFNLNAVCRASLSIERVVNEQ